MFKKISKTSNLALKANSSNMVLEIALFWILAHCENYVDKSQTRDDHFTLTLTFLHVVALARKKQPLLDFLDQEISMEDWLEPVTIRKSNLQIIYQYPFFEFRIPNISL